MNEAERSFRQQRIEVDRSIEQRNRDGQFATPYPLAEEIVKLVGQLWPEGRAIEFLEPCVGTGAFYSALRTWFPRSPAPAGSRRIPRSPRRRRSCGRPRASR